MLHRAIEPRQISKHGKQIWQVVIPKDLRGSEGGNRKYFGDDKDKADAYAKQLSEARKSVGSEFMKLTAPEQSAVIAVLREFGVDELLKAAALWRLQKPKASKTVQVAVDECIEEKRLAGCRDNYLATLRCSLESFARTADKALHEVIPADVSTWLNGNGWKPKTRLGYLKDVSTLFKWAQKRGMVPTDPTDGVERPRLDYKPPPIFKVEEVKKILGAIAKHDPGFIGYVAPILFGGLRPAESARLTSSNVKANAIDLSGDMTKLRGRRVVKLDGLLRQWLAIPCAAPFQGPAVKFGSRNLAKRRRKLAKTAGVTWSHDILRHTFCSYAMEKFGAKETARLAGHSEQVLFAYYREIVTPEAAEAFWAISPGPSSKPSPAPAAQPSLPGKSSVDRVSKKRKTPSPALRCR